MDNFCRRRFCPTSQSSNKLLNTTLFAAYEVPIRLVSFRGYCSLSSTAGRIDTIARALHTYQPEHCTRFVIAYNATVTMNTVRCPRDISGRRVISSQWCRPMMCGEVIVSNTGLFQLMSMVLDLQQESGRPLPLLVHVNFHYQNCKFFYRPSYAPFDLGSLNHLPIMYGMWHAYKYCITVTWREFLPFCTFVNTTSVEPGWLGAF